MASWQDWKKCLCAAAFMALASGHATSADLSFSATPSPVVQGSSVSVAVLVSGIADLYGYQFTLSFNPSVLQATTSTEGPFLATGGATFFDGGTIDNSTGKVSFVFDTLIGALPGVNGAGVLARVSFNALAVGSSPLTFSDVILVNSAGDDIVVQAQNSSLLVTAVPEPATALLLGLGIAGLVARRRFSTTA